MKKKIVIIGILIIFFISTLFSIIKFNVINPISSCFGIIQILFTNKEYVIIQEFPKKVILAKPNYSINSYMESRGFNFVPEEQMGSILVFNNGNQGESMYTNTNAYYSKWIWR